jgi:hypothetical protein
VGGESSRVRVPAKRARRRRAAASAAEAAQRRCVFLQRKRARSFFGGSNPPLRLARTWARSTCPLAPPAARSHMGSLDLSPRSPCVLLAHGLARLVPSLPLRLARTWARSTCPLTPPGSPCGSLPLRLARTCAHPIRAHMPPHPPPPPVLSLSLWRRRSRVRESIARGRILANRVPSDLRNSGSLTGQASTEASRMAESQSAPPPYDNSIS